MGYRGYTVSGAVSSQQRLQKLLKKGLKHRREGHVELAEACYRKILNVDPLSAEAKQMLRVLQGTGADQESSQPITAIFGDDTATFPESAEAQQHLGEAQERAGDLQAAANSYQRALALKPDSADLHCHLARALYRGGALLPAAELYRRALVLDPKKYEVYNDLGLVLTDLGNFPAALEVFRRSLINNPRSAKTIAGLGRLFERKGDLISAAEAYRDAIKLDPNLPAALLDLGFVLYGLGELAEAADCFARLRALQPDSAEATVNLGLIHLLQGNLAAGWAEYESRWKVGVGDDRKFLERRWKGEALGGERILLYAEQGLGDTMQFVRYVPLVAARGGEVVLEVQPALWDLLAHTEGASRVIRRGETLPEFRWQCPLMSLPLALGTELNTITARVPYIVPDAVRVEAWRERLQKKKNTRRIGLAWAGNPAHPRDRLRSIALEQLMPLLNVAGTTFYSLQFGSGADQMKQLPPGGQLIDLGDELKEFGNVAAIVANLDSVISIDSAVAHLAGALGKPVWILLNKGCDWRWFLEREDSPWYPTARLFRQTTPGQWQEVVNRIETELRQAG
jgi:tetratricopeptide (TPR) repeat protein